MRNRVLLLTLLLLIVPLSLLFAGGASEGRLVYLPRNVVNNSNVMIELSQAKQLSTISQDFSNTSTDNLALFRLRDTLRKDNSHSQPTSGNGIVVTISSLDNWQFIHENNPTSRIDFTLNAFCTERQRDGRNFNNKVDTIALGSTSNLKYSGINAYFKKENGSFNMFVPYTTFGRHLLSTYADYIREYDVCVRIPENVTAESGYYTTRLEITSQSFTEYDEDGRSLGTSSLSYSVTIRGYVGIDPGTNSSPSFFVSSTADTYSMNLDLASQPTPYIVANVQFLNVAIVNSSPNESTQKTKYTIYISPTNNYSVGGTGTANDPMEYRYKFIRIGSENQARTNENTIYYDLCLKTSANGYTALKSCTTNTNYATGKIGSAGVLSNSVKTTFKILPKYDSEQISSAGLLGGSTEYKETWELNQDIYLKLTSESMAARLQHQPGIYYSNIYFTMVSN